MKHRDLGMERSITRRDFVNGVAVAVTGSLAWRWSEAQTPSGVYPPALTGMRGSHDGSFEVAHAMRDGARWDAPEDTGEVYDLVVVGGGLSGLASAWYFREAMPDARILILDNHDDFGGHARRNEFWHDDRMLLVQGGTEFIENMNRYGEAERRLMDAIGVQAERYSEYHDDELYRSAGLQNAVFFGREIYGEDRLVTGEGQPSWREFLADTPLSEKAQADLVRLYESDIDYLGELGREEKIRFLQQTSYREFLMDTVGIGSEAVDYLWRSTGWAIGFDAISAAVAAWTGWPGISGLGLDDHNWGDIPPGEPVFCQFPDGNATIARLLVRSLVPGVAPGHTQDDVVAARFDYDALDEEGSPVRIRLNSTVVNVRHRGDASNAEEVDVTYVSGGKAYQVRGGRCVMACYNAVIPYLCEELPDVQKEALSNAAKATLVFANVLIRNWRAFDKLNVRRARCPGSYFELVSLTDPINIGDYRHSGSPDEPVVVQMHRAPLDPQMRGQAAPVQWRVARASLLSTTFETFEKEIRSQLGRMLSAGGFDPARDIEAIIVNRWPHGYAYGHDPETGQVAWMLDELPPERSPWLAARKRFGRIAIANSDATADAMTEGALKAAHLAIQGLLG
jgi:spermidine dehydrogenase